MKNKIFLNFLLRELIIDNRPNFEFYKWYHKTLDKYKDKENLEDDKFRALELNEWLKFYKENDFDFYKKKYYSFQKNQDFYQKKFLKLQMFK